MATHVAFSFVLLMAALILSSSFASTNTSIENQDLEDAIEEMRKANYFTFVMLINMASENAIKSNVTFFMPNDRTLAKTLIPENSVGEFLLRHSIPSPLLFDHLVHFPTGSMIPTSKPEFMLEVSNNGRKSFYLSNVRLISPNLCTAGYSIRCHGIDGVVEATMGIGHNTTLPSPTCSSNSSTSIEPPSSMVVPPLGGSLSPSPLAAPPLSNSLPPSPLTALDSAPPHQHNSPKRSGSSHGAAFHRFWPEFLGIMGGLSLLIIQVLFV